MSNEPIYTLSIIEDNESATGVSTATFIQLLQIFLVADFVLVNNPEWLATQLMFVQDSNGWFTATAYELMNGLPNVQQIDWADFAFYTSDSERMIGMQQDSFKSQLINAVYGLSIVDNTYFYVYTRNKKLTLDLSAKCHVIENLYGKINELPHPY